MPQRIAASRRASNLAGPCPSALFPPKRLTVDYVLARLKRDCGLSETWRLSVEELGDAATLRPQPAAPRDRRRKNGLPSGSPMERGRRGQGPRLQGVQERRQKIAPPFGVPSEEGRLGEAVPGDMLGRHAVTAAGLDPHLRLRPERLEPDLDLGELVLGETRPAPSEGELFARRQWVTRPTSNAPPCGSVSVRRPLSRGSKAMRPGGRG